LLLYVPNWKFGILFCQTEIANSNAEYGMGLFLFFYLYNYTDDVDNFSSFATKLVTCHNVWDRLIYFFGDDDAIPKTHIELGEKIVWFFAKTLGVVLSLKRIVAHGTATKTRNGCLHQLVLDLVGWLARTQCTFFV
jgi:hypothetical protein